MLGIRQGPQDRRRRAGSCKAMRMQRRRSRATHQPPAGAASLVRASLPSPLASGRASTARPLAGPLQCRKRQRQQSHWTPQPGCGGLGHQRHMRQDRLAQLVCHAHLLRTAVVQVPGLQSSEPSSDTTRRPSVFWAAPMPCRFCAGAGEHKQVLDGRASSRRRERHGPTLLLTSACCSCLHTLHTSCCPSSSHPQRVRWPPGSSQ